MSGIPTGSVEFVPTSKKVDDGLSSNMLLSKSNFAFQITRLKDTWAVLRQKYTESAVLYEKTLRPSMRSMNEGEGIALQFCL